MGRIGGNNQNATSRIFYRTAHGVCRRDRGLPHPAFSNKKAKLRHSRIVLAERFVAGGTSIAGKALGGFHFWLRRDVPQFGGAADQIGTAREKPLCALKQLRAVR